MLRRRRSGRTVNINFVIITLIVFMTRKSKSSKFEGLGTAHLGYRGRNKNIIDL